MRRLLRGSLPAIAYLIVYFMLVTPIGLVARLLRDPLDRRRNYAAPSYFTFLAGEPWPRGSASVPNHPTCRPTSRTH